MQMISFMSHYSPMHIYRKLSANIRNHVSELWETTVVGVQLTNCAMIADEANVDGNSKQMQGNRSLQHRAVPLCM